MSRVCHVYVEDQFVERRLVGGQGGRGSLALETPTPCNARGGIKIVCVFVADMQKVRTPIDHSSVK